MENSVDIPLRVKNTAGTGPRIPVKNTQTCQCRGRVQTKHAVLQPMRADFQKQIVECGKVNDKDAERAQRSVHKLHVIPAHIQTASWAVHKTFRQ